MGGGGVIVLKLKRYIVLLLAIVTCFTSLFVFGGCGNTQTEFTITFDADGGTLVGDSTMQVTYGKKIGEMPTATKDGLNFIGWYLSGTDTKIKSDRTYTWKKNITLKARFSEYMEFQITLDVNGGLLSGGTTKTAVYGYEIGELPSPTKDGLLFSGWYFGEGADEVKVTADTDYTWTEDITLKAKYQGTYNVTINLKLKPDNDASDLYFSYSGAMTFSATPGSLISNYITATPTINTDRYDFEGWKIKNANGTYTALKSDATFSTTLFGHNANITLYVAYASYTKPY